MWFVRIPRGRFRPMAARMAERFGLDQIGGLSKEQAPLQSEIRARR